MSETQHLWPAPGLKLRDEDTFEIIPPEGAPQRMSNLTYRRLNDDELLRADPRPKKVVREAFPDTRLADGVAAPATAPDASAPATEDDQPEE
jgi:hypothetical protein